MATMGSRKREWTGPNAIVHMCYVVIALVFPRVIR